MPEQELNLADVGTLFEQVTGKGVAQRMGCDGFPNLRNQTSFPALQLNRQLTDVLARKLAREEPIFRILDEPPGTQDLKQFRRQHRVAIFLPFALLDPDDHAFAVDGGRGEGDGLRDAQPGGIARGQDDAMLSALDAVQKVKDFLGAQDDWQFLRLLGSGNHLVQRPIPFEGDLVQETEGRHRHNNGVGGQFLFVRQIDLVGADLLGSSSSGDLWKCRAKSETCWTYTCWVPTARFRTCMSSISMPREEKCRVEESRPCFLAVFNSGARHVFLSPVLSLRG